MINKWTTTHALRLRMMVPSLLAAALGAAAAEASASPPNVLIVLTDDQGWGDTGTTVASWCAHPPALSADSPAAVCPAHRSGCRSQGSVAYSKRNTTACPRTPHIDALATGPHSVLFHRFYSGAGVCSPTRASVLLAKLLKLAEAHTHPAHIEKFRQNPGFKHNVFIGHTPTLTKSTTPNYYARSITSIMPGQTWRDTGHKAVSGSSGSHVVRPPLQVCWW
jgi:hypothetical protein